jgi:PAS domain S-box-containing protein
MPTMTARLLHLEAENERLRKELEALRRHKAERLEQTRKTLAERERDLRSILDNLPSMIGYWDRNLRNRLANHAYLTWFGIDPETMPGKHIREVIGEERYRLNLPYIEAALQGQAQTFERAIPMPDGRGIRHSLANYLPDIVDGEVRGFYVLVTDITDIKTAEEALRTSEERYRTMLEDQTDLIARLLKDGTHIYANGAYCRFFGKTCEELIGQKWMPICYPDDIKHVQKKLHTLKLDNPVVVIENRVYSGTGEVRWGQFINRGLFDSSGELIEIQTVGRDITVRKNAEAALQEAHEKLEQRVRERTEDLRRLAVETTLTEERERQAIAQDLHDDLGQTLHVARIKLDALGKQLPDSLTGAIQELNTLVADASRMIRSLTSQLSPPVLKKLGLVPALHWLAEEMAQQYGLQVAIAHDDIQPMLSPAQSAILFRSARELLINVVKHSGTHSAWLKLNQNGANLILSVEDAGIGISDYAKTTDQTRGFGLASIRERLEFLGGKVDFATPEHGGLRVTLCLPPETDKQRKSGK